MVINSLAKAIPIRRKLSCAPARDEVLIYLSLEFMSCEEKELSFEILSRPILQ
jgi:hypothetical protein